MLTKSADPDEMLHFATFRLNLHNSQSICNNYSKTLKILTPIYQQINFIHNGFREYGLFMIYFEYYII